LKKYSEEILGEYQCGFRPGRRTTDQIFMVRQIQKNFMSMISTSTSFSLTLKKAFDSLNQKKLLESLVSFGIPRKKE
jgi:sorting nexin-29